MYLLTSVSEQTLENYSHEKKKTMDVNVFFFLV